MNLLDQYRGMKREVYFLAFGRLVTGLGAMIWPMMTLILSRKMGVEAGRISWLLAAAMIVMAPAVYLGGKLADVTSKKYTIIVLDLISVICYALSAFLPMSWGVIFLLFIGSLCQNMEHPPYHALITDMTVTADRDRAFSLQYLCANLGLMLAPTISGILFVKHLNLAFLINSISIFSSVILIFFGVKDTVPLVETDEASVYQRGRDGENIFKVLQDNPVVILFIIVMSGYFAMYQMYTYLMPLDIAAIQGERGALIYGSVTSVNCLVVVAFTPVVNRLFGDKPETVRIVSGFMLLFGGFAMFVAFMRLVPVYYMSMVILTLGEVFTLTAESPYMSRRVPSTHRGRVNGAYTFIRTVITSVVTLVAGALYSAFGSLPAWISMLAITVGFIAVAVMMDRRDRKAYANLYER
ncbi:MAG: MFS transporter [Mogibacterium sp.]|nr:MFS transporter [Mogibacterium sp.]